MAKLASVRAREVVRAADGRRVVIPMHGTSDLKPGTLRGLITDMGLTPQQFAAPL